MVSERYSFRACQISYCHHVCFDRIRTKINLLSRKEGSAAQAHSWEPHRPHSLATPFPPPASPACEGPGQQGAPSSWAEMGWRRKGLC